MYRKLIVRVIASFVPLWIHLPATAVTLGFSPSNKSTNLRTQVSVELVVSNLGDNASPSLGEFDLVLGFDSEIIAFDNVVFGDVLNPSISVFTFRGESFTPPASLNLFEISGQTSRDLIALQPSNFTLATLTFDAVEVGTSDLILSEVILGNPAGLELDTTIESGSIQVIDGTVTTVPEASTKLALLTLSIGSWFFKTMGNRD